MKIFLVEDDYELNKSITSTFNAFGYEVTTYMDGKEAFDNISTDYDIFLIDINLPNINGLELVKQIKQINLNAKIFIMSGDINIETIVYAYDLGCDDYIKKPFDIREIHAKVNAAYLQTSQTIHLSDFCIYNPVEKELVYKNKSIRITNKESLLLDVLVKNIGKVVTAKYIEHQVWGELAENTHVRQLVSKLRKSIPCDIIKNHVANGYLIEKYIKD